MNESKTVVVLFKSGESLTLRVTDFKVHILNGHVTGMDWKHPDDAPICIAFVDVAEIAAAYQVMD
jgi:hypothetical protein